MTDRLTQAVLQALEQVPTGLLEQYADDRQNGRPTSIHSGLLEVKAAAEGLPDAIVAAFIHGALTAHRQARDRQRVDVVLGGPRVGTAVRSTMRVLLGMIDDARNDLLLTTYSARPYSPVITALANARIRGVGVDIVVETLDGAGSSLSGTEPAHAFRDVPGARLWHWPSGKRDDRASKLHAKIAVADRKTALVSSVNLTQSGVNRNIEAGVLINGGETATRLVEHFRQLFAAGVLQQLA